MRALLSIAGRMGHGQWRGYARGALLAVLVLASGSALLGLSGWFVTAAGAAGLAGIGIGFDFFRPSAGVRMLALGRTAARYGERLLTHDATLRSLAELRAGLLGSLARQPYAAALRLRGGAALNRIMADVDALDGLPLRLVIPALAALVTLAGLAVVLWLLTDVRLSLWVALSSAAGLLGGLAVTLRRSQGPARCGEAASQALRVRVVDMLRGQTDLAMRGALGGQRAHALDADRRARIAARALDRIDRGAGFAMATASTLAAAGALALGARLAGQGVLAPSAVALGFFATLALTEIAPPLRRGLAELGRMTDAARRVDRLLAVAPAIADRAVVPGDPDPTRPLTFEGVSHGRLFTGIDLALAPGEAAALVGPSGSGKSTLLAIAGGLIAPAQGRVRLAGHPLADWPEAELRHLLGMLPQRSALISGGIREALALGAPDLLDGEAWAVLEAVALRPVVERIGGLDGRLGEAGTGLSGGERRRLALARVLARRPLVLLLDEPTEGLDRATADRVLAGVRQLLPQAAILVAAHRPAEREWADRSFDLTRQAVLPGPSDGSQ